MRPVNSARSENRSSVESQNAPNADCLPVMCATLPSMKSKMLATIDDDAAQHEPVVRQREASRDVDQHADERQDVGVDAERDRGVDDRAQQEHAHRADGTGKGHASPWREGAAIMGGSLEGSKPCSVADGDSRSQGPDRTPPGAARGCFILQPGGRDDLRRQGARAARSRPESYLGAPGRQVQDRRPARRDRPAGGHRHRLGDGSAGAREQPDQAAEPQ